MGPLPSPLPHCCKCHIYLGSILAKVFASRNVHKSELTKLVLLASCGIC